MRILFLSRQNAGVLPTLTAVLCSLLFNPALGKAQGVYSIADASKKRDMGGSEMTNIASQLEHNALLALLGVVALVAILYIYHVSKACTDYASPCRHESYLSHSFFTKKQC